MTSFRLLVRGAALAVIGLVGCSGETGILLRVSRDSATPAVVPRLHLALGVRAADNVVVGTATAPVDLPTYVDDVVATETIDTSGLDLAAAPYEVLLSPSAELPITTGLEIAALGLDTATPANVIGFGAIGHEVHFVRGEVLQFDVVLAPVSEPAADPARRDCGTLGDGALSIYACRRGCIRYTGDGGERWIGAHDDIDCDGDPHGSDCDDYDWTVNHNATDVCNNGKNDDCAGVADDGQDRDGDGKTPCDGDCVDNPAIPGSAQIHPGATEVPTNGIDDDCSGQCDEPDDRDHDTYTASGFRTTTPDATDRSCAAEVPDCNDQVATINPGASEIDRNGFDDDCDGHCDVDGDGDGYTVGDGEKGFVDPPAVGTARCEQVPSDCNDDPTSTVNGTPASSIHPDAPEICDGLDDDCNGKCDDGLDADGDGYTVCGTVADPNGGSCTYVGTMSCPGAGAICDCAEDNGAIHPGGPALERCDGLDSACDGVRFATSTTCFAFDAGNVCRVGARTCDDFTPPGSFGACIPGTIQAPDGACNAFSSCAADPDPLACVADQLNTSRLDCVAQLQGGPPVALCATPPTTYEVLLPPVLGTAACGTVTWDVIGGPAVGAWSVGLVAASGGMAPAQMVSGTCQPTLVVTGLTAPSGATQPPPAASVLIIARRALTVQAVIVTLGGHTAMTCPDGSGLLCAVAGG
ncbi:MAG: putative metal-binding motif-containing protein [Deltaproteobacteria bacterium]|nr:putative metal-binding motif-containing protein [Deltaproteobacteria bacterium]